MLAIALALMSGGEAAGPGARIPWISPMDYPAALSQSRPHGTTEVQLTFNAAGRVTGCTVVKSSGTALLDSTTCRLAQARGRARAGEARVRVFKHYWAAPAR